MGLENLLNSLSEDKNTRRINSKGFPNGIFLTTLSGQCLLMKLGYGTNGLKDGDLTVGLTNIYK
tara:strand:- start:934 stop:1125 length:192 start_codon:yes stop_codon:yes gene_type:complete